MTCPEIRELMPDLAAGLNPVTPQVKEHLRTCGSCAGKLEEFRQTMALLDEWQAPEPSPYFDVRLQARRREETAKPVSRWLQWVGKPALALSLAVLMVVSVTLFRTNGGVPHEQGTSTPVAGPGTAVGDLQALDKNHELYSDFDVLDDLEVQHDVTANP
jgi:predicted anti-sigma-YlaC factor YlaD